MKKLYKITITVALLFTLMLALAACDAVDTPEIKSINVTYVYNNGEENKTEEIYKFAFERPEDPKKSGYKFVGWCTDQGLENFYNFEISPSSDITLYAKWETDYAHLLKDIGTDAMLSNVKIEVEANSLFTSTLSQGSGVIYKYQDGVYYVLTNYHVVEPKNGSYGFYYVYDAYGNKYRAVRAAGDPTYDLAVLCFEAKSGVDLTVSDIDERIPSNTEDLICLGSPSGRFNSVTLGKAVRYEKANVESNSSISNVEFDVLWLDCYAEHGSSGGAIFDADFDIVGITYAVASDQFGSFKYSIAVPSAKIIEFLTQYGVL